MIEVRQLRKEYPDLSKGSVVAIEDLSFRADPGQIFGLLGLNGAGKTTVLRILSTILAPTAGTARIGGYDVVESPENVRRQIGFVSNNLVGYERMSGKEMVAFFGRLHAMDEATLKSRMALIFDWLQIEDFKDVLGSKMSTGMKQKVSIARAIIHDPPVLIFDEATVGLDVLAARSLLKVIRELRDEGKCIIFSTHHMREAEYLCDHIAILNKGRIIMEGSLESLRMEAGQEDLEELFFQTVSCLDGKSDENNQVTVEEAG